MNNFLLVVLLVMIGSCWCNLTLATLNKDNPRQRQVVVSKTPNSLESSQISATVSYMPQPRAPRSLYRSLDTKKSLLLRGQKKLKEVAECCSSADTGEYIRPETAETVINGLFCHEKSSLDYLLRNNTGPLTLAELLADLTKDDSELNFPEGVQLTNKAVVEALLSKSVLLRYPLIDDRGIIIADHRALVTAYNSGNLRFPLRDRFGVILRDLSDALPDGAKEVLGTLLGGNVVSDILESNALGLLNYPIKDARGIPVLDVGTLLLLVAQGGFKNLKFPMFNAFHMELRDDTDLLLILIDGGFLKNLVYPLRDANGVVVPNKQTFLKALREGLAFKGLKYPIKDSFGITIKRPDALMGALLDDNAARAVGFPLTDVYGAVLKDKLQLFLTLLDGGLNLVTFPLRDDEGNYFKDKMAFLIAIVQALRDKQGLLTFLQRSVTAITKFPLRDNNGATLSDKTELLNALLDGQALSGLKFPYTDCDGHSIPNKDAFLSELLQNGLDSIEFPLTNRDGRVFTKDLDVLDSLIDGSALRGLKYPLHDKRAKIIKDQEQLLQHVFKNDLKYPLTDCALTEIKDFAELMSLLLEGESLDNLQFPLYDGIGGIFKNKADFLGALLKGGLEALNFPLKEATGGILKSLENLLQTLLNNSILSQLVFPLTDVTGVIFNNKLDFVDSLLGGVVGLPNLNLTGILNGVIRDTDTLLQSLLGGVKLLSFPLTDVLGHSLSNSLQVLERLLRGSPGLRAIYFPLTDKLGRVIMDEQALLDILPDANALSALSFPLIDCAGTVYKNKDVFLRRLLKGISSLNFPLTDGTGLQLPDGRSLLEVLLQAVLNILAPVFEPLVDVLKPVTGIINILLNSNITAIESLLTGNFSSSFSSSSALRFPLLDASGRNITNQLELFEILLYGSLKALAFPLFDGKGHIISNRGDFLKQILKHGPLANLQFPLRRGKHIVLRNEQALITAVLNNILEAADFPLTAENGVTINSKLELLTKLYDKRALYHLNYPLIDSKKTHIFTQYALLELLTEGALESFKYPVFDSNDKVLEDKESFAEAIYGNIMPSSLKSQQSPTQPMGILGSILSLLERESSLSEGHLVLVKAIKQGLIKEGTLKGLLGTQKFAVLKQKLDNTDKTNALDVLHLRKILDAILDLLLKKKPELFMGMDMEAHFHENSFT